MKIKQRGGMWYVRTWVKGRERYRSTKVPVIRGGSPDDLKRNREHAKQEALKIEMGLWDENVNGPTGTTTVKQWYERYEKVYIPRQRDQQRAKDILTPFVEAYGNRQLGTIAKSDCVEHLNSRGVTRKPTTIAREQGCLAAFFQRAIDEGKLRQNPWRGIKRARYEARTRTLSADEQTALMKALNDEYQRFVIIALGTGLRESELLGLRPTDVDRSRMLLLVRAENAKMGKSRTLPLLPDVLAALDEQQQYQKNKANEVYFPKQRRIVRQYISRAAEKLNLPHLTVHDLRRTFGTRHALSGTPPKVLMMLMGHSSIQTTMKYYVHVEQQDMARWMQRADLNIGSATQEQKAA